MAVVAETALEAWELLRASEAASRFMTYGGGKAVLVAGFWWLLDPVTGVPVYAIAGENDDVHAAMNALGYSEATHDRGVAVHDAIVSAFGYSTPKVLGKRRRPEHDDMHAVVAGTKRYRGGSADDYLYDLNQAKAVGEKSFYDQSAMSSNDAVMSGTMAPSQSAAFMRKRLRQALSRVPRGVKAVKKPLRFIRVRRDIAEFALNSGVVQYRLGTSSGSFSSWTGLSNGMPLVFTLADLSNYTEITSLFDQYRIVKIETTFIPLENGGGYEMGSGGAVAAQALKAVLPVILYCADENDSTSGSEAQLLQQENVKMSRLDRMIKYSFKPVPYISDGTGRTKVLGGWCQSNNPSVVHYALKVNCLWDTLWPVDATNSTQAHRFVMLHKFVIEAKSVA